MAVYNGEKYLAEQMASILGQLGQEDELVISLDPSGDQSKQMIRQFADIDRRIVFVNGPGKGAIKNFENALAHTRGAYIFLSDQDDVWAQDKLLCCLNALQNDAVIAVIHDGFLTDEALHVQKESIFGGVFHTGAFSNIVRNRYIGCLMAFKRELLGEVLPFPSNLPMHDQWIGILANRHGTVEFVSKPLIYYRRHGSTATGREKAGLLKKLKWRLCITVQYLKRRKRHV
jgi:glycosyltransferase involved in cell wall biosynthesis